MKRAVAGLRKEIAESTAWANEVGETAAHTPACACSLAFSICLLYSNLPCGLAVDQYGAASVRPDTT